MEIKKNKFKKKKFFSRFFFKKLGGGKKTIYLGGKKKKPNLKKHFLIFFFLGSGALGTSFLKVFSQTKRAKEGIKFLHFFKFGLKVAEKLYQNKTPIFFSHILY